MSPSITLRVDDATRRHVEDAARVRGITTSDFIRDAVEQSLGLAAPRESEPNAAPATLTVIQRRTLAMQHEILAALDPKEADHHRHAVEILTNGYTLEYSRLFELPHEMPQRDCRLVMDILDMFRMLEHCISQHGAKRIANEVHARAADRLSFRGFDLNDSREGTMLGYVEFLTKTGRWQEVSDRLDAKHDYGNSHSPMLRHYQELLDAYEPIFRSKNLLDHFGRDEPFLTIDEIRQIHDAAYS